MKRCYVAWKPCEPTPSWQEATEIGAFKGNEDEWHRLTPGMRREIVRSYRKTLATATH